MSALRTRYLYILLLPAMSIVLACGGNKKPAPPGGAAGGPGGGKGAPAKVDGYIVRPTTITDAAEVPGTIVASESTEIRPEVSGRLVQLRITEGRYVGKGALLAKLYDGDLQAQLRKLQVQLKIAQQTEERQAKLLKIQGISRQDYDLSLLQVYNIKADMDIIRTSIAKTEIRAPFSGIMGLKQVSPGAYITPASVLATLRMTSALKLDFQVPEKYTASLRPGAEVVFSSEATGRKYTARVVAAEPAVDAGTRSQTIRCQVVNGDANLLPGAFARVQLQFAPTAAALQVPSQAIIPQARGKKVILYRGGVADFAEVKTGLRDSAFVEVESGLQAGDTVVVTGLMSTKPGAKIKIGKIINQ